MSDEQITQPAPAEQAKAKRRSDRYIKLGFLAAVLIVGTIVLIRQYLGSEVPGFQTDLDAAMKQAKADGRMVLVVIHDRPPGHQYEQLARIFRTKGNKGAMARANVVTVSTYLAKSDPLAKKYGVKTYPTTLLLSAKGDLLDRREGFIPETDLPGMLYARIRPAGWSEDIAKAAADAATSGKNLVVLLRAERATRYYVDIVRVVDAPKAKTAVASADVVAACGPLDPKSALAQQWGVKQFPSLLLVGPAGNVMARREGDVEERDFADNFLLGKGKP